ncbi:hypothetical protein FQS61_10975 [Halomonas sp. SBBP1]|nr:hypothetical protein [Halomonas sp. SBBP1]
MNNDAKPTLLKQRRSRRQVLTSLGLGAAALYVAPTLLSMNQAQAHDHRSRHSGQHRGHSRPGYSRPSYSRPSYSKPRYSRPSYSRPDYSRPYGRRERRRWERDGVIELRISRLLPHRW